MRHSEVLLSVWPPPATRVAPTAGVRHLPFPLEEPGTRLYAQARQALHRCVPALGLSAGDEVLVPQYHHGSEVEALLRAGLVVRSYDVQPDLQPDADSLDRLVGARTRALHLVHHLGQPQDAAAWRRWCDERGLLLLEDAAQAWLATRDGVPVGSHGDLAVFCLYKTLGLPDGAAVTARVPLPGPEAPGGSGARYLLGPAVRSALRRTGWSPPERAYDQGADLALPDRSRAPAPASRWLLPRAGKADAAAARRAHQRLLLRHLGHLVPPGLGAPDAGASPFAFPLAVPDKAAALAVLARHGVQGLDLWSLPHPRLPDRRGTVAAWLRAHVVCLPVHQDLTGHDLERLVRAAGGLRPVEPALQG